MPFLQSYFINGIKLCWNPIFVWFQANCEKRRKRFRTRNPGWWYCRRGRTWCCTMHTPQISLLLALHSGVLWVGAHWAQASQDNCAHRRSLNFDFYSSAFETITNQSSAGNPTVQAEHPLQKLWDEGLRGQGPRLCHSLHRWWGKEQEIWQKGWTIVDILVYDVFIYFGFYKGLLPCDEN